MSRIGDVWDAEAALIPLDTTPDGVDLNNKADQIEAQLETHLACLALEGEVDYHVDLEWLGWETEPMVFFYHPDHLGSSSFITGATGEPTQHLEYLPFGELFIEERSTWNTPYKFSAKELDDETGYSYFGARYYDPNISIWLSVDPLSDKHPDYTPYAYVYNNPVNLFDPFGLDTFNIHLSDNSINRISVEGSSDHTYNIYGEEGAFLESYDLEENDYGFVSFPEDGPNWGRYGSRDKGGDNWASPATAAAFFGLLYSWSSDPLSSDVYFDDISGFMGQNIGHTTHRTGDDIDIRYFGAGSGANINSASIDCSTCWNTISKRSQADYDLLFYSTYNFLRLATEWGFETNYVYPQGFPFTRDRAHNTHRHHIHIGR